MDGKYDSWVVKESMGDLRFDGVNEVRQYSSLDGIEVDIVGLSDFGEL
jgi:hypothetical protein